MDKKKSSSQFINVLGHLFLIALIIQIGYGAVLPTTTPATSTVSETVNSFFLIPPTACFKHRTVIK